ncbi:MAG TPA: PilZ domain-containing protein [Anaeromyxobacteraceae bacterium]|nr:PilZ domain-containing protein [Anaeromyxobacteraceae bacterium]
MPRRGDGEFMLKFLWSRSEGEAARRRGPERRAAPRLDKAFPVWLEGDRGFGMGVARNISEGGMFVETTTPQPIASQVRITFPSSSGEMTAVAEVRYVCHLVGRASPAAEVHASVHGMGVRFLHFEAQPDRPVTVH